MLRVKAEIEKKQREDAVALAKASSLAAEAEEDRLRTIRNMEAANTTAHDANGTAIDQPHTVEYSNGDVYVGELDSNGQRHGLGTMTYALSDDGDDDVLSYTGSWSLGLHNGHGKKVWLDDLWYEGEWKDGMMHGKGVCHMNDVDVLEGMFENDEFCG
jgi:hypothetical protein